MTGQRRSWRVLWPAALLVAAFAVLLTGGCGSGPSGASTYLPAPSPAKKGRYFTHVIILVQENRTFDNLFATFPGADGVTVGKTHDGTYRLRKGNLESPISPNNGYRPYWLRDCHADKNGLCRMNGFDTVPIGRTPGTYVYRYVDPQQVAPYWDLAKQYVLSDHTFSTQGSGSFTAHQDLIRGGTEIAANRSLIDFPTRSPWGCDAPAGTVTSVIDSSNQYMGSQGPFPCLSYATLRDLLDARGISWRYYTPSVASFGGSHWNAFDAISAVRRGSEWSTNVVDPETDVFTDIDRNTLPAVAWVIPDFQNSDHPGNASDTGPSWVAQVVNAIGQSQSWETTAILIVWDDWGGWYDHVPPPGRRHYGGLGFRVPLIAVAPYAKTRYVSHHQYEFGSIIRFVEANWHLGNLGTTDVRSADFANDFFDFAQSPRNFTPIATKYSRSDLLRRPPSGEPVDTE